jgi:hypothetical protein
MPKTTWSPMMTMMTMIQSRHHHRALYGIVRSAAMAIGNA